MNFTICMLGAPHAGILPLINVKGVMPIDDRSAPLASINFPFLLGGGNGIILLSVALLVYGRSSIILRMIDHQVKNKFTSTSNVATGSAQLGSWLLLTLLHLSYLKREAKPNSIGFGSINSIVWLLFLLTVLMSGWSLASLINYETR